MTAVTRTSLFKGSYRLERASTAQNQLLWVLDSINSLAGNDSVSFDPYALPEWRRLIREGYSATTSLTGTKHVADQSEFSFLVSDYVVDSKGVYFGTGFTGARGSPLVYASVPTNSSSSMDRANNKALSQLAQKLYQAQHTFQGGVAMGEFRQTVGMLRSPAQALRRGLDLYLGNVRKRIVRRGKYRSMSAKQKAEAVAGTWLEYSYGWRPLINDIESGYRAARQIQNRKEPRVTVTAGGTDTAGDPNPGVISSTLAGGVTLFGRREMKSSSSVKYRAQVMVKTSDQDTSANTTLGFDPESFIPTLWELIPYSFLVDYFTNIGNMIYAFSNLTARVNWIEKGTSLTESCKVSIDRADLASSGNPNATRTLLEYRPASASFEIVTKTRRPYNGSIVPSLQFSLPTSNLKWINMAALSVAHNDTIRALRK